MLYRINYKSDWTQCLGFARKKWPTKWATKYGKRGIGANRKERMFFYAEFYVCKVYKFKQNNSLR